MSTHTRRGTWVGWTVLLGAAGVLLLHSWSHMPFMSDDAFISLRYADRLLSGGGLTWTDGPRIEGYTNFLWLMMCAGLGALGLDLVDAARLLGVFAALGAIAAVVAANWPRNIRDSLPPIAGAIGLGMTGCMAVWAIGGLEQPLVAALLGWAAVLTLPVVTQDDTPLRRLWTPSLLLGLMCLTRADAPVLCVGAGLGVLLALGFRGRAWKIVAILAALPLAMTAAHLAFRYSYYGRLVPNSAVVKVAFTPERVIGGAQYMISAIIALIGLLGPALFATVAGVLDSTLRRRSFFLGGILVIWLIYVTVIGGDIFPAWRQLMPALLVSALLCSTLISHILERPGWGAYPAGVTVALMLAIQASMIAFDVQNKRARDERWEWDGQAVGHVLQATFDADAPLLAVDAAGALPYYSKLPALDMLGLNDAHVARHRTPEFGKGHPGHELGDGDYVLSRKPDLIVFGLPTGQERGMYRSGIEMQDDPRFHDFYRPVTIETGDENSVRATIWVRAEDGKIGIERSDERIAIPGFLTPAFPIGAARPDDSGRWFARAKSTAPARYDSLDAPPGRWMVEVDSDQPVTLRIRAGGDPKPIASGRPPLVVDLTNRTQATISLSIMPAAAGTARVYGVTLSRQPAR